MACYLPIRAWRQKPSGPITIGAAPQGAPYIYDLPCGACLGCLQAHANTWALRARHEASGWRRNTFLNLTYNDEELPAEGHLDREQLQRFIKRLRRARHRLDSIPTGNIRYLACGEYGEQNQRPHYHLLLFNCGFNDCRKVGVDLWESELLNELWTQDKRPLGHHRMGEATPGGAAGYIAKYTLKRYTNNNGWDLEPRRQGHRRTGQINPEGVWRPAPFLRMSLRPAIGNDWLARYHTDLTYGYLEADARKHPIPRYYRKVLARDNPTLLEEINRRMEGHRINTPTDRGTPERRKDEMKIHEQKKQERKL